MNKFFSFMVCLWTSFFLLNGCAMIEDFEAEDNAPWRKEIVILFRKDITDFEKEQFYSINSLEFLSQYYDYKVRCRIISGESIDDFTDRLSSNPYVDKIEPYEP